MDNIVISIICVLMQVGFLVFLNDNELINRRVKQRFITLTGLLFVALVLDNLALEFDGCSTDWVLPMKIIKASIFSIAVCLPMVICNIIVRKNFWKHIRIVFYAMIGINTTLQFLSIFTSLMFRIDENAVYHTTFVTLIYAGFLFIGLCLIVFSTIKTYVQNLHRFNSIIFITGFIVVAFILRLLFNKYSIDSLMLTISLYMFMIFFSNSFIKIDKMTSLLNQETYFSRISQVNYSTVIVEIDMNNFKHINDTYGHKKGDEILSLVGELILEVYGDVAYCFRRGGDEFAVIFKPGVLDKLSQISDSDIYTEIKKYITRLNNKVERASRKHRDILDDGLAQGYGIFYTYGDCAEKENYKEFGKVLDLAEERLYKNKTDMKEKRNKT